VSLLSAALRQLGLPAATAARLASHVRERYVAPGRWFLFDDTVPVLETLASEGWSHIILSNHVPELPGIVRSLGVSHYFRAILTSAALGYEKPHPEAFRRAIQAAHGAGGSLWMVGDDVRADVFGALAAGLNGILVRRESDEPVLHAADLAEAARIITAMPAATDTGR
jgi:putative hydrolase of the HAD superfamily